MSSSATLLSTVYERLKQLESPAAAVGWARQALLRRFLDRRRWLARRPTVRIDTIASPAPDHTRADVLDLRDAVRGLSRADRALIVLHYWDRCSLSECAKALDIPEGTAKSRLNRALGRLRALVKEDHA